MRWSSTPESANDLEFTWLSLIETFLACSLSLWAAWYWDTFAHIIIAICLAPFLLLRTNDSTNQGIKWFDMWIYMLRDWSPADWAAGWTGERTGKWTRWWFNGLLSVIDLTIDELKPTAGVRVGVKQATWALALLAVGLGVAAVVAAVVVLGVVLGIGIGIVGTAVGAVGTIAEIVGTAVGAIVIKFMATLQNTLLHPIQTISSIPTNWYRIAFTTDSAHPPEIMPGIETYERTELISLKFSDLLETITIAETLAGKTAWALVLPILFLPAMLYRWSLKSTFVFYLPLLWIAHKATGIKETNVSKNELTSANLECETVGIGAKIKLFYAGLIALIAFSSLLAPFLIANIGEQLASYPTIFINFVDFFFFTENSLLQAGKITETSTINFWHITRFLAAGITVFLFFYAERILITRMRIENYKNKSALITLFWSRIFRTGLSLFTLACGFYIIVWPTVTDWRWVEVVIDWVPW